MRLLAVLLVGMICARTQLRAQTPVTTWHYDNERTSANTTETVLTLSNVNKNTFGKLFSKPVDGFVVGHPLYLPGLTMPGQGTRNVVFVTTMHNSVYAFDADNPNAAPFWVTSILNYSPAGATPVSSTVQKNAGVTGWTEVGIISTPVIDPTTGTLYVVAETSEGTKVVHRLHALDVTTGLEKFGGPATIAATYSLGGVVSTFQDLYQINRPGLLLANGHVYIAFGSNCCNAYSQGWVMSYNATTLKQEGAFDAEPGKTLASVWQRGAGISADSSGNIYAETGDGPYAPGTNLSESILKLSQSGTTLSLADWFTPYNYANLSSMDMDMADGVLILPDQSGPVLHEAIAIGKEGTIYVLNRDSMGGLCTGCTSDTNIVQELTKAVGFESGTPVYWNNTVFFTGTGVPALAYTLTNGKLSATPTAQSIQLNGSGHGLITANGNTNGILWFISGSTLWALNAQTMKGIYTSDQAANGRDKVPPLAHFASPIVADGKLFIGTQNSLVVYGLLAQLTVSAGNGQTGSVGKPLPIALKVRSADPYSSTPNPGVTVTFSDSNRGGVFNPPTAVTDANGYASTTYTLPGVVGTYTITASAAGNSPATFTETAVSGTMTAIVIKSGYNQSAPLLTPLPASVVAKARDANGNGIPGVSVTFTSNAGGTFSANPVTTDSAGLASVNYTTGTKGGHIQILANVTGFTSAVFYEYVTPGSPTAVTTVSGNAQTAATSTLLAKPLVVKVTDQYGNVVPGVSVTFADGGAGGSFSANPAVTGSAGTASLNYTTPANAGPVTIKAMVSGVSTAASFTVTVN